MSSFRPGLTRLEIVVTVVIGGLLVGILRVGGEGVADADFELVLNLEGNRPENSAQRVVVVPVQETVVKQMLAEGLSWRDIPHQENPVTMKFGFSYRVQTGVCLNCRVPEVANRALLIEYVSGGQPAKYRLVPFEIPIAQQRIVTLSIPREPPSDADAWKPE